jgi:hypothetical protein
MTAWNSARFASKSRVARATSVSAWSRATSPSFLAAAVLMVTSVLAQLPTLIESLTGVDLRKVIEAKLATDDKPGPKGA